VLGFYLNHCDDTERLARALAGLRRHYAQSPVFVFDDRSAGTSRRSLLKVCASDGRMSLMPRQRAKCGWESYDLVLCQLENWSAIRSRGEVSYLFKMDTDTLICSSGHAELLRHGADLVGNRQGVGADTAARYVLPTPLKSTCAVFGGGYFVRLSPVVERMLALWKGIPRTIVDAAGRCFEDQTISMLCWTAGGKVQHHEGLRQVRYDDLAERIERGSYAVHPVKTKEHYGRLMQSLSRRRDNAARSEEPSGTWRERV
jgi:hypothetical protein